MWPRYAVHAMPHSSMLVYLDKAWAAAKELGNSFGRSVQAAPVAATPGFAVRSAASVAWNCLCADTFGVIFCRHDENQALRS